MNLEIIVDSSGSMAGETDTGAIRMDAAKQVLQQVVDALPESPDVNVGMRVYGHLGNNTESGRAQSCASSDLVVPVGPVAKEALLEQVNLLSPVGWTPLAASLEKAQADFPADAADATNAVILLTDGIETCDGDPAAQATDLKSSSNDITTYVIGFATTPEDQLSLEEIAAAGGGELFSAANTGQLMGALFEVLEELEVVEEGGDGSSRSAPIGRGRIGKVGDFEISVVDYTPNATDIVLAENQFNESPDPGYQFAMAEVSVTYVGESTGEPSFDLSFQSVGNSAVGYSTFEPGCGVYPNDQYSAGELFTGGTAQFNVCWMINSEDEDSLVMYVEELFDFNGEPMWFSLGNPVTPLPASEGDSSTAPEEGTPSGSSDSGDQTQADVVEESSRTSPIPVGNIGEVADYQITVLEVTPDATDVVLAENQFNESPRTGNQFYIARVKVTSIGTESGEPSFDLNFQAVGESAVGYTTFDNTCGVYPEDHYSAGELFSGGTVEFNVCWEVDSADVESLVMYVEPLFSFDEDPIWFALSED